MKRTILISIIITFISISSSAQYITQWHPSDNKLIDGKTIIKGNLTSLLLNNYGIYGERIINKNLSAVVGINTMPERKIPFRSYIKANNKETDAILDEMKISSISFTPELRIYTGKGYGRGFYLSPYYRYEQFTVNDMIVSIEVDNYPTQTIPFAGDFKTHAGGLLIGYQWLLGKSKNIVLDWSIFGIHYGKSSGDMKGTVSRELSEAEQEFVKTKLDEMLDFPLIKTTNTVNSNSANINIDGPWSWVRGSLSIGYRF